MLATYSPTPKGHTIAYAIEPAGTVALPERERVPIDR
jgi:hypothetical protein